MRTQSLQDFVDFFGAVTLYQPSWQYHFRKEVSRLANVLHSVEVCKVSVSWRTHERENADDKCKCWNQLEGQRTAPFSLQVNSAFSLTQHCRTLH